MVTWNYDGKAKDADCISYPIKNYYNVIITCLIIVESECLNAVNLLNDVCNSASHHYSSIIELCRLELSTFSQFKVVHVFREANYAADRLASFAGQSCNAVVIYDCMPNFLVVNALADRMGTSFPKRIGIG